MKVVVLAGGTSDERDVSMRSGAAVDAALRQAGHEAEIVDPAHGLSSLLPILQEAEVIFPALHGAGGEDGKLQEFLEANNLKYVGADSKASALCFDKHEYTKLLQKNRIKMPYTELVDADSFKISQLIHRPFVLKPNDGGSSIDTFIVRAPAKMPEGEIDSAFSRHPKMILQELIEGTEITVAMLGEEALPVIEIIPPSGKEFDYENKYNGATLEVCPPRSLSIEQQVAAKETARQIHKLTGCRDMSRTDFIVAADGTQYVLETNTIPGLTNESLLPKAAQAAGYTMPALCQKLIESALSRG